jgi:hypothetical protein
VLASAGVAVGMALQGSLSNLAGGIMLLGFRPFNVGDYIIAGGEEGTVKSISTFYTVLNTVDNKTGVVNVDSVMRHVVFTISILSLYTNLEFTSDENSEITSIDEYDMLCESKLLRHIIDEFAEEYAECEYMLNTMQNDLVANSNTVVNVIGSLAKQLVGAVESFSDTMKNMNLDQDNIDKITDILGAIKSKE